jgi:hypothetical protein
MKIACASLVLLATSSAAAAFVPSSSKQGGARFSLNSETGAAVTTEESSTEAVLAPPAPKDPFDTPQDLAGVVAPFGFFDPLNFAKDADAATMKRYREAEITHGRVGMLAVLGFLAGEFVEGSSFLFDAQISGPAITHLNQVPPAFWILLTVGIGASESTRLNIGWVSRAPHVVSHNLLTRLVFSSPYILFILLGRSQGRPRLQARSLESRLLTW